MSRQFKKLDKDTQWLMIFLCAVFNVLLWTHIINEAFAAPINATQGTIDNVPIGQTTPRSIRGTDGRYDYIGVTHMTLTGILSTTAIRVGDSRAGDMLGFIGDGQSSLVKSGPTGYVLKSGGVGVMPRWEAESSGTTDWANPGAIGSVTPSTGKFTTLSFVGDVHASNDSAGVEGQALESRGSGFTPIWASAKPKVVQMTTTTLMTVTSSTPTNIPGLSTSITPTSASNKVMVIISVPTTCTYATSPTYCGLDLHNGTSTIVQNAQILGCVNSSMQQTSFGTYAYVDSPATTSTVTYTPQAYRQSGGGSCYYGNGSPTNLMTVQAFEVK